MNPEKIGRYEIKGELGRGGMATVYRAYDPRFEREVALKVLPREMLHDSQFRVRFEREAKTVAMLEHQAIVPVYDVGEEDGQPYFVMRYMTGGSLSERIKQGPTEIHDTARIISRIASALDEAHAKKIIHRDLKPGNILFDSHNEPYISDFGIAKFTASSTNVTGSAIIGTPAYISPEQAQGEVIDGRSDIYALGIILFEMLSGRPPYDADTPMAVVVKHITEPVPHILDLNANLPAGVEAVIERAMAKNRDERFASASQMAKALEAVARGETPDLSAATVIGAALPVGAASGGGGSGTMAGATRIAAAPGRPGEKTTVAPQPTAEAEKAPRTFSFWIFGLVGLCLVLALVAGAGYFGTRENGFLLPLFGAPTVTPTPPPSPTATVEPTAAPTETATEAPTEAPIEAPTEAPTEPPIVLPVQGDSDQIAVTRNNDIFTMNIDGSNTVQLTDDGAVKTDLQFLPDHKNLIYIIGTSARMKDLETHAEIDLVRFNSAEFFDAFRVSPDGTQVALSVNNELFVVPFDVEALSHVTRRSDLEAIVAEKGCLDFNALSTQDIAIKEVRWSKDGQRLALQYLAPDQNTGLFVDAINVFDISKCMDTIPGRTPGRVTGVREITASGELDIGTDIVSWDWDGENLFLITSNQRNDGFGRLILYNNLTNHRDNLTPAGTCCYRDVAWSNDTTYLGFAFQDITAGSAGPIDIYYIPFSTLTGGGRVEPVALPDGFYEDPRDKPQTALRPVP
jgi:serine/threonine-protein kinase